MLYLHLDQSSISCYNELNKTHKTDCDDHNDKVGLVIPTASGTFEMRLQRSNVQ